MKDRNGRTPLMGATKRDHINVMKGLLQYDDGAQVNTVDNDGKTPLSVAIEKDSLESVKVLIPFAAKAAPKERIVELQSGSHGKDDLANALSWALADFHRQEIVRTLLTYNETEEEKKWAQNQSLIEWAALSLRPGVLWWLIAASPRNSETKAFIDSAMKHFDQHKQRDMQSGAANVRRGKVKTKSREKSTTEDTDYQKGAVILNRDEALREDVYDILRDPPFAQFYKDAMPLATPKSSCATGGFDAYVVGFFRDENTSSTIRRVRGVQETVYQDGPKKILKDATDHEIQHMKRFAGSQSISETIYDDENRRFAWIHLPATNIEWMEHLFLQIAQTDTMIGDDYLELKSFLKQTWFEIPDRISKSRIMKPQFVKRERNGTTAKKLNKNSSGESCEANQENVTQDTRKAQSQAEGNQENTARETHTQGSSNTKTAKGATDESKSIASSAVYMPFSSFSTHFWRVSPKEGPNQNVLPSPYDQYLLERLEKAQRKYEELMPVPQDNPVSQYPVFHGCPTLDEAYYHFDADSESRSEEEYRNRSQVVTKQLNGNAKHEEQFRIDQVQLLPILRVNQIWIWTIADKWLISAASHPVDDVEQLWVDGFLDHLNKAEGAQYLPSTVEEMRNEITTYCIGSYERRRVYKDLSYNDIGKGNFISGLSVRQVFSNYINFIGREETRLFNTVRDLTKTKKTENDKTDTDKERENGGKHDEKIRGAMIIAQNLLSDVKDVRDELNILQWIADCKEVVQRKMLTDDSKPSDLPASYILKDIRRMEQLASRIQEAVNSTLSLLQNEIATFEAEESVKQGKESVKQGKEAMRQGNTIMAFTLVTVLFVGFSIYRGDGRIANDVLLDTNGIPYLTVHHGGR
ncbi:hypothetical protein P280DRAFT_84634 [Massarina eburnea CBS 473.64]|uniref:Uncharacterized protein n=1 Tax=Massarina eburnea CBS 473.64 TaxID=1395130 RepID=A0A6A6RVL9_9PLEO|nr:hypothetical protein P280DRAFT_84634 [Massarina eburnea CBS 473.64]